MKTHRGLIFGLLIFSLGLVSFAVDQAARQDPPIGHNTYASPIGDIGQGERAKVLNARLQAINSGGNYAVTLQGEAQ